MRKLLKRVVPNSLAVSLVTWKVLSWDYGHFRSVRRRMPVDSAGDPIPWYTYPAIDYLSQLDFSHKAIFEFGSGNSTRFWGKHSRRVVSIEHDEAWYNQVKDALPANVEYRLLANRDHYVNAIREYKDPFDVIIIDGRYRAECIQPALDMRAPGALVILDNAERYPTLARNLRDAGLIEVDMFGFGPINHYIWCTSLFFSRDVTLTPLLGCQPCLQGKEMERG